VRTVNLGPNHLDVVDVHNSTDSCDDIPLDLSGSSSDGDRAWMNSVVTVIRIVHTNVNLLILIFLFLFNELSSITPV